MTKILAGICFITLLSGCCGMYTNCNQPRNNSLGATCGCGSDCATGSCKKVTY